jgi:hypothetical protein
VSDLLLDGFSLLVSDGSVGGTKLSRAVRLAAEGEISTAEALRWGWHAAIAAGTLWDLENWRAIGERLVLSAREAGLLVEQHLHLNVLGMVATWRGDFAGAASRIAEADAIAEVTGTRLARYAALQLAGVRGV